MKYILKEFDYNILELLQKDTSNELSFTQIVNKIGISATEIYKSLDKMRKWNLISLLNKDYACYKITKENKKVKIRKVMCHACKTIKRIHDENQARTVCINPNCRTPSGKERQFEIIRRDLLKQGIKKRINHVQM